ncbi:pullulanase-type alpha-1,6-glucosidase [Tessaracoccus flavus]|uniref:pullulanase-type alpha-1,6-glucosidase n=1 Tax=Tessaracoccus flavus TaxID=1610493 RepID=UPI0021BC01A0|nr:pullulanase-type alpha-1,6-glucosidase [Tessaracoccus flavus]
MKRLLAAGSALALAASSLVIGVATPAAAAVSPVVAGSFQTLAGCASDWDPACTDTALTDPDGDGVYTGTFTVPAGEQKFKIVLDGDWDQAYGPNNNRGGDAIINPAAEVELTFSFDSATNRVGVSAPLTDTGTAVAGDDAIAQPAVRQGDVENFYFVLTDRFANGDPSNDTGGIEGGRLDHGFDPTHNGFYHGGDIAGLVDQLDYIEGLGTTAIWLTPSFTNRAVQGVDAGYHGYWVTDFTTIDPHLGGNEALTELTTAAHERGMKVYFDIITNHTADGIDYEEGQYTYIDTATEPYRNAAGEPIDVDALAGSDTWPALDPEVSFAYTPVAREGVVKTPSWLNDLTLYHNRGNSTWSGESVTHGDFDGLDDLMTEHPTVVDGMIDIYKAWMDMGIDGFRIDTVKHVNFEFWEEWTDAISDHADAINPDFFMFGEVYDADPGLLAPYVRKTEMDATLDFAFQSRATNFAKGFTTKGMSDLFTADDLYLTADTSAATIPTFLGNHDMGRIGYLLAGSDQREDRSVLAHQLMYLTRGQPVVYYGDEQGFVGIGNDKSARQDMFATEVDEYATQPLLDGTIAGSQDRYLTDARLYTEIAELAQLREDNPALADGAQIELHMTDGAGVYAFSRVDREEKIEYVVALNNATTDQTVDVNTLTPSAAYAPVYNGTAVTATADGVVGLTVPALSAVVLKADRTVAAGAGVPTLGLADGASLSGDTAPVSATVTADRWAETTFAMRELGSTDWQTIGVAEDDTPRVFADVSALATGSLLEVRAVTVDAAGAIGGDSALAVVGQDLSLTATGTDPGNPGDLVISVPGSMNAAMGCAGDWEPGCAEARLSLDENSGLYTGAWDLPAGAYEWKVAYNGSWDENYGVDGVPGGGNFSLTTGGRNVTFFHNPDTKLSWAVHTDDIVTLPGSWQAALGCPGDWQPECLATAMRPVGDGTWVFETDQLPAGSYELKVAINRSWAENYGVDGAPDGANYQLTVNAGDVIKVTYDETTHVLTFEQSNPPLAGVGQAWAQWLTPTTIAWPRTLVQGDPATLSFALHHSADGSVDNDATGGETIDLTYGGALPADLVEQYPHLSNYVALTLAEADAARAAELLEGELLVSAADGDELKAATGVQIPGVLDSLYGDDLADADLGPAWDGDTLTLSVWAPTAQDVALLRWPADGTGDPVRVEATRADDGSWSVSGDRTWEDAQYLWAIDVYVPSLDEVVTNEVTDPYSLALTLNSTRSVVVDLDNPELAPEQWASTESPTVLNDASRAIWEVHVRDFSIRDETVPAEDRGTYKAFTHAESDGMTHLAELADAGIDTVHLLPTFDIATIEEDRSKQLTPDIPSDAGPASEEQQAAVAAVADQDAFNWGYDPFHYTTPEGSYATDANQVGGDRTYEFRQMVGALHATGLQVVLDKVYNHTAQSGQSEKSVLDKVVPGYYHRLSLSGTVETSTCCQNIATEHAAAEKLMVDSVVTWAKDYKVDGFRFDLMGHHSRANMEAVRAALDELTLAEDGVDGSSIYIYGEGWNFGEVADNARFYQATQGQLDGTGIGAFNDRLRDAVHGGGPFDEDHRVLQGFGTGLYTDPNGLNPATSDEQRASLMHAADLIRIGMAGNLEDYTFEAADGTVKRGDQLDYNGSPAAYATMPQESVNYVDAHDNETLYDLGIMKLPVDTSMADRVRMNTVSLATVTLGQSPSFWHAGTEILRSKSLDRDSYNSGDHFNEVDWSLAENTFGSGLPSAEKNSDKWPIMKPLLENPDLKPDTEAMTEAKAQALDLLRLRKSTPLLTLGSADLVHERVTFPNAGDEAIPGLILMAVADHGFETDVDPALDGVLVAINGTPDAIDVAVPDLADWDLVLSDIQADGSDEVVKATAFADGTLSIPARTAALLVAKSADVPVDDTTGPVITPIAPVHATQGKSVTVEVKATDDSLPLVYSATGLPAGLAIDSATGVISGIPTGYGTFHATVTVTDQAGNASSTTVRFNVARAPYVFVPSAPYTKPGTHFVNGRQWMTTCEPYSQTVRCRTLIWASVVNRTGNTFTIERGWAFNNLTYLPFMTRQQWANNPLGHTGEWTADDGSKWRTECDTALTGANGCRTFRWTTVYNAVRSEKSGDYDFTQENKWVFNNMVMFRPW